jgi:hypothetical protein
MQNPPYAQAGPTPNLMQANGINANSRQQFIIEEEGAYSQRSSDDENDQKGNGRGSVGINNSNTFNTNSTHNLSKKPSQHIATKHVNPQFTYSGVSSQEPVSVTGKSLTRNMQNESQNEPGSKPDRDNFNGDTGHDYNLQQEEYTRRQNALAMNTNQSLGGSQSKSRGRQPNMKGGNPNSTQAGIPQQYTQIRDNS